MKHQIPSSKSQTMTKAPMTEMRGLGCLDIGYCDLFGILDLGIGI